MAETLEEFYRTHEPCARCGRVVHLLNPGLVCVAPPRVWWCAECAANNIWPSQLVNRR